MGLLFFISPAEKMKACSSASWTTALAALLQCYRIQDASEQILRNIIEAQAKYTVSQVYCSPQVTVITSSEPLHYLSLQYTALPTIHHIY